MRNQGLQRVDLAGFSLRLREALRFIESNKAAQLLGEAMSLRRELEQYRAGTRERTLEQAARVAILDRELIALDAGARLSAICARTGYSRAKVYRLRKRCIGEIR